jgi:hypothetical protein
MCSLLFSHGCDDVASCLRSILATATCCLAASELQALRGSAEALGAGDVISTPDDNFDIDNIRTQWLDTSTCPCGKGSQAAWVGLTCTTVSSTLRVSEM